MTHEDFLGKVQAGLAKRLRVAPTTLKIEFLEIPSMGCVGLNVFVDGGEPTESQKTLILSYMRETIDPMAMTPASC